MERSRSGSAAFGVRRAALGALAVGVLLAGCGPTRSTSLIMDADVQLQAAKTADAEKLSPYEYTAAQLYLHKAREEQGYSDFEVAIDFAEKSLKYAKDARKRAMAAKGEGALPDLPVQAVSESDEPTL